MRLTQRWPRLVAGLVLAAATAGAAWGQQQAHPPFWPGGQSPQVKGFDYWRVWLTRSEARRTPTSLFNLADRTAVMRMWVEELGRRKLPVDDVAPRRRLEQLSRMIGAQDISAACREVDAIFRALEDLVEGREHAQRAGSVMGVVLDPAGAPAPGADVMIFGSPLGAVTDEEGRFFIRDVPLTPPRYILHARKLGYLDAWAGRTGATPDRPGEAVIMLEALSPEKAYRAEALVVKVARLVEIKQALAPAVPLEAAFMDMAAYPAEVQPYLKPGAGIDSEHPDVRSVAQSILASVPETDRLRSTVVARAVYGWLARNIEHDVMEQFPADPTCAHWQLTFGAWGRSLDDWRRKPSETLAARRAWGVELETLAAALLRALNIPARPAWTGQSAVCQWWVQLPAGNGYWANMDTSAGREQFRRTGNLDAAFASVGDDRIAQYGVDERAGAHIMWNAERPALWLEDFGQLGLASHNERGLRGAGELLAAFEKQGVMPRVHKLDGLPPQRRVVPGYEVASHGIVLSMAALGAQKQLTVRFPLYVTNQFRETLDAKHWTNHPDWVKAVRREREHNEITKEVMEWYCIDLEPGAAPPGDEAEGEGEE